mmetsp:Transcript_13812/g.34706  ORF Transcript_13812/g.34706 Transcript_13812/m.34706 type:complete len:334 (+) Transcript_13812:143-1144(+)
MLSINTTSDCIQQAAPPQKVPTNASTRMVQELNNRACVLVTIGDYAKANQLLGLALEKHKRTVEGGSQHVGESVFDDDDSILEEASTVYGSDYEYDDDDMDTSSNDTFDFSFDCPRDQESNNTLRSTRFSVVTSKMSTCTEVCNIPHSFGAKRSYHKIYALPIVMDDSEWKNASPDDRSFVLVFNSALSNHLWGMKLLSLMGPKCHKGHFETAKALYLLALETLWNTGSSAGFNGGRIRSVDKLCVPAIFNNLSHCSKVLDGYGSRESSVYDSVLLKSVFWWIDGNSSVYTSPSVNTDLRRASDGDAEVIEAFLDTVFYLIGSPQSTVPAAAA